MVRRSFVAPAPFPGCVPVLESVEPQDLRRAAAARGEGRRTPPVSLLPVEPAHRLATLAEERRWLVTGLWAEEAVGIVGGEPKCSKSFLALDLAVSVASGTPCLRRFPVSRPGGVLLFAAEDALHVVRRRLEGICAPPAWTSPTSTSR